MQINDIFEGCIMGGAIGDAFGSIYENQYPLKETPSIVYPFGKPKPQLPPTWCITDDTQLTLATCESIIETKGVHAKLIAAKFSSYYKARKLTGLGASTLKALQELEAGGHWSKVGRKGEFAAGNGAAMRIAPLAFTSEEIDRSEIESISRITHHHDEAYAGALSIVLAVQTIIKGLWTGEENLLAIVAENLPDTKVKDRLLELAKIQDFSTISSIGKEFGSSGYVVESVPLSIFAASKVHHIGFKEMLIQLTAIGGDTDTNCSMAGQIAGALLGITSLPSDLKMQVMRLQEYTWIKDTIEKFASIHTWDEQP